MLKDLKVRPQVVADVAFTQFAVSSASTEKKEALAKEFKSKWRGTGAEETFITNEKVRPFDDPRKEKGKLVIPPQ